MDDLMHVIGIGNLEEVELQYRQHRKERVIRDPMNELSETQFRKMFRLSKDLFLHLVGLLEPIIRPQRRNTDLPIHTKILSALHFFASGSYQGNIGSNAYMDISQRSICISIREVVDALNHPNIFEEWVHFPRNLQELNEVRQGFFHQHRFPGLVGCIDCTHVAIVPPPNNDEEHPEHIYVNRKSYHSINVQLICDANLKILNVNSRYPGSTNDCYIWNQSNVQDLVRTIHGRLGADYFLLGDSGYPLRSWLLTPFAELIDGTPEAYYNYMHKNTRAKIECCNGLLKARFRCLRKDRVLHYKPEVASKIITACVVLHNMCIVYNIPPPEDQTRLYPDRIEANADENEDGGRQRNAELAEGRQARNKVVRILYARRRV